MRIKILLITLLIGLCQIFGNLCSNQVFAKKAKIYTPESNYKYHQKILRQEEIEKYKRSLLPESGLMTREEYEEKSKEISSSQRAVPEYKLPKDIKMKYVPQPIYKLARYNNPPGTPELKIDKSFKFDRHFICPGVTSPNKNIVVYPIVYYYAANQCTACDLFVILLDMSLPEVSRIQRANIIKQFPDPILSTQKDIKEKFTFRTITPIDFSTDGTKFIAKEKIGNINDGIWQTNLWVYDFTKRTSRQIPEIRDAIRFYWKNQENLVLDEKRWDIYPLGFDANNPDRIVVSAYGYTGKIPKFLGVWSIDYNGERTQLISLFDANPQISLNGYKLIKEGVVEPVVIKKEEKRLDKIAKHKRKAEKKAVKKEKKQKKHALKKKLKEMKKEEKKVLKEFHKEQHFYSKPQN